MGLFFPRVSIRPGRDSRLSMNPSLLSRPAACYPSHRMKILISSGKGQGNKYGVPGIGILQLTIPGGEVSSLVFTDISEANP